MRAPMQRTSPELTGLLDALAKDSAQLNEVQRAVVREARREVKRATTIPQELVQRMARLEAEGYAVSAHGAIFVLLVLKSIRIRTG